MPPKVATIARHICSNYRHICHAVIQSCTHTVATQCHRPSSTIRSCEGHKTQGVCFLRTVIEGSLFDELCFSWQWTPRLRSSVMWHVVDCPKVSLSDYTGFRRRTTWGLVDWFHGSRTINTCCRLNTWCRLNTLCRMNTWCRLNT